jgi:hypothetical protein
MEISIALKYAPGLTMLMLGPNGEDGLPTALFLGQTFHVRAGQISDRSIFLTDSLLPALDPHSLAWAYAAWA